MTWAWYVLVVFFWAELATAVFCLLACGWQVAARWFARRRAIRQTIEALTR